MRIRPLEFPELKDCYDILKPPDFFRTMDYFEKLRFLSRELPIRLEKTNEIVWKKYPNSYLEKIDDAIARLDSLSVSTGNLPMQNSIRLVKDVLTDVPLLFKNYEEMVAFVSLFWYTVRDLMTDSSMANELKELRERVKGLEMINEGLRNRNMIVNLVRKKLELLLDEIDYAKVELDTGNEVSGSLLGDSSVSQLYTNVSQEYTPVSQEMNKRPINNNETEQMSRKKKENSTNVQKKERKLDKSNSVSQLYTNVSQEYTPVSQELDKRPENNKKIRQLSNTSSLEDKLLLETPKKQDLVITKTKTTKELKQPKSKEELIMNLTRNQKKIYKAIKSIGRPVTYKEIAEYLGLKNNPKSNSIRLWTGTLVKKGLLKKVRKWDEKKRKDLVLIIINDD